MFAETRPASCPGIYAHRAQQWQKSFGGLSSLFRLVRPVVMRGPVNLALGRLLRSTRHVPEIDLKRRPLV
jgi:hypothetical protein